MNRTSGGVISSFHNPRVQFVRSLIERRSPHAENGLFVAEGIRMGEEVLAAHLLPKSVYFSNPLSTRGQELLARLEKLDTELIELTPDVLSRLSATETSQGLLFVLPQQLLPQPTHADLVLIIDQLRDPGNLGTLLRTAAAVGVPLVFFTPGNVDPFMPKVVRAGMGAHFRLCLRQAQWTEIIEYCRVTQPAPLKLLLASSAGGASLWQTDLTEPLALIVGGEAAGASPEARQRADTLIHIPMPGNFESLNAGVAASIILYELIRQRSL